jgi:hypothetical protein
VYTCGLVSARVIGRYLLCDEFAAGGIASVHLGLQLGDEGFTKTVAIKRLHAQFAKDPEFAAALVDEGRMQARVQHPNVAAALDVVRVGDDLLLVIEYLHAVSLAELFKAGRVSGEWPPIPVLVAVMVGTLRGLHAAHEARSVSGAPLDLVHRDVSPHNILVGADGIPRVVDFGIAHATDRSQVTREGMLKGKPGYMAPEQVRGEPLTRAADIYAAGVVLWELVTRERLFPGGDFVAVARAVLDTLVDPPSAVVPTLPPALDAIVARAVARDPGERFPTAAAFADALERVGPPASAGEVAAWVQHAAAEALARRAELRQRVEREGASGAWRASHPKDGLGESVSGTTFEGAVAVIRPPAEARARPPVSRGYAVLAIAALGVAVAAGAVVGRGERPAAGASAVEAPGLAKAPSEVAAVPSTALPVPAAETAAPAVSTPPAPLTPPPGSSVSPPRAAPRASRPASAEPCVTVGADGIKHWNPRCK